MENTYIRQLVILILLIGSGFVNTFAEEPSSSQDTPKPSIPELIRQLESRTFAQREQASQQLIQAGSTALRPLARNLNSASPEIVYRTRKIIQEIARSGDESTFLKSAGILKLVMFGALEGNHSHMKKLEMEWKEGRTQIAAQLLRDAGAEVKLINDEVGLGGANPLRLSIVSYPQPAPIPRKEPKRPEKLSKVELRKTIDQILVGSIDQNRNLVFGNRDSVEVESERQTMLNQLRAQQLWVERDNFLNNNSFSGLGNTVTLGANWTGNDKQFEQLNAIENLTQIRLESFELSQPRIRVLSRISSLDRIELRNCSIAKDDLEQLSDLSRVTHVGIFKQEHAHDILSVIKSLPNLRAVEISDCQFKGNQLERIAQCRNLVQIFLTGLDVPADALYEIGDLRKLRYLNLKSCTFDVSAFQSLKKRRPNISITTVARAFLGVRGPVEFGADSATECKISEVIPGSGADKAGVLVGDVITQINGHEIGVFNDLILYISQHDIGDSLTIDVIRDGKELKLSAELGKRGEALQ